MDDFRQKQKMRRIMYSRWMLGALAFLLCIVVWKTWGIFRKERLALHALEESRAEHTEAQKRANELTSDIDRLNTEAGVEEVVRDRYGVAKEGEEVIVLVDAKEEDTFDVEVPVGFWAKFKAFFKGDE